MLRTICFALVATCCVAGTSVAADWKTAEGIAVQICAVQTPPATVVVEVISDGDGVSSTIFKATGADTMAEGWRAQTIKGQHVATLFKSIYPSWRPDAVVVANLVLPVPLNSISADGWTDWRAPVEKVNEQFYAIRRANGRKGVTSPVSDDEAGLYRVRFKRMDFEAYLENMPSHDGPKMAWTSDPIPGCN